MATRENSMVVSQKDNLELPYDSVNSTPRDIPKRTENEKANRHLYVNGHSIIFYNSQKVETSLVSINGWRDSKIWYICILILICILHMIQYHSTLKRNKVLTCAIMWMNLENVMLSEISMTQKDKHGVDLLIWGI